MLVEKHQAMAATGLDSSSTLLHPDLGLLHQADGVDAQREVPGYGGH